ncbi:hypothetical protein MXB_4753, partial [Myxobolus squamalis]
MIFHNLIFVHLFRNSLDLDAFGTIYLVTYINFINFYIMRVLIWHIEDPFWKNIFHRVTTLKIKHTPVNIFRGFLASPINPLFHSYIGIDEVNFVFN